MANSEGGRPANLPAVLHDTINVGLILADAGNPMLSRDVLDSATKLAVYSQVTAPASGVHEQDAADMTAALAARLRARLLDASGYLRSVGQTDRAGWVRDLCDQLDAAIKLPNTDKGSV